MPFGTGAFDSGFVDAYLNAGFRVVQLVFASPGWEIISLGRNNLRTSGCRPATALEYIFEAVHGSNTARGFCAQGQSGGGTALGFSMSWYEMGEVLDYALLGSSPNFADVLQGCDYPIYPNVTVCGRDDKKFCTQQDESYSNRVSFEGTFPPCSAMLESLVGYPCYCPDVPVTPEMRAWFAGESVVGPGATYKFKETAMSSWVCAPGKNVSPGQAELYAREVRAKAGYSLNLVANCSGAETYWDGIFEPTGRSGLTEASSALIEGCVPRHDKRS